MSKKTDFAEGKCKRFSTTPYSRGIQREKKLKNFKKSWRGSYFPCTLVELL